jgi:putative transposase
MARQARLVVPDVALHIVQRGVNRADCFRRDADRLVYLALLQESSAATGCAIHAYCLMTNHVHLLVTPSQPTAPAALIYKLGQRYVPYFNRRHARTGTLWEGRFKSCLVESPRYVLACHRYIETNPVRAGMVDAPADYPWSSHAGNVGAMEDKLLTPHPEFVALGRDLASRRAAYLGLFGLPHDDAMLSAIRSSTVGGYPLVGDELKARLTFSSERTLEPGKPGPHCAARREKDVISGELDL